MVVTPIAERATVIHDHFLAAGISNGPCDGTEPFVARFSFQDVLLGYVDFHVSHIARNRAGPQSAEVRNAEALLSPNRML